MATNTAEGKLSWIMSVRDMPHQAGFSYPVFEWSFGNKDGIRGGELRAWPLQGILVFEDRRAPTEMPEGGWRFQTVGEAIEKINEYGWGNPPHLDEVFKQALETKAKFPLKSSKENSVEEAKRIFKELQQKWETLVVS